MKSSVLKFVPSRSSHYLYCSYFLRLSNFVNISINEPPIVAIQRAQQFKKLVINRLAVNKGVNPTGAKKPLDFLKPGLMSGSMNLNVNFFSTESISLAIGMFKPDVIETVNNGQVTEISIKSIKNKNKPEEHHYLQTFVYKLALEKALKEMTIRPLKVRSSVIYWNENYYPDNENENLTEFMARFSSDAFFTELDLTDNEHAFCVSSLHRIASLEPKKERSECEGCIGQLYCDAYSNMDR